MVDGFFFNSIEYLHRKIQKSKYHKHKTINLIFGAKLLYFLIGLLSKKIKVILINLGEESFVINQGDRIAQGVITPVMQAHFTEVDTLDGTVRGEGGLGSTGI